MAPASRTSNVRRHVWVGAVVAATALVAAGAAAAADRRAGWADKQSFAWTDTPAASSTSWEGIPELVTSTGCQFSGAVAATLALELEGSDPVQVRIAIDIPIAGCPGCPAFDGLLKPRNVTLRGPGTRSFTFVGDVGTSGAAFHPQWRVPPDSPGAGATDLEGATLRVLSGERQRGSSATC